MKRLLLLVALALATGGWPHVNLGGGVTAAGGGGATDFTSDANAIGCWLMFTDGAEASAEADQCSAGGTDNMTYTGTAAFASSTAPTGSASGQDSSDMDGTDEHFTLAHQVEFEAEDFTIGCWVSPDDSLNNHMFSKNDSSDWDIFLIGASDFVRAEVNGDQSDTAATTWSTAWHHIAFRYDGTGTSADATDDAIEVFLNGAIACDGACGTNAGGPAGNTDPVNIADTSPAGGAPLDGQIMECFYMDRVLSDAEMAEVFLCGFDGTATGATRDATYGTESCTGAGTPWAFCTGVDAGGVGCGDIDTCC